MMNSDYERSDERWIVTMNEQWIAYERTMNSSYEWKMNDE
jgi:hypothetical protein